MASLSMENFEILLSRFTALESRELLGAIGIVVDYEAGGLQSLSEDAQALDKDAVFELGSAGKFFTHIAALQCVERGLIGLDESVFMHLPELESLQILTRQATDTTGGTSNLVLQKPSTAITLRHLLTHTSGIADASSAIFEEWEKQNSTANAETSAAPENTIDPLLFNPGEGWSYGPSINWTIKLVTKLTGQKLPEYVQTNIFDPLGMTSSTFSALDESTTRPDLHQRRLQMILRQAGSDGAKTQLVFARRAPPMAPATSTSDYGKLLAALMWTSSGPQILSKDSIDLLFSGQLSGKALQDLRADTETYSAPTGLPPTIKDPKVNFGLAGGLFVEQECQLSGFPAQTLTWNGMPNVIWSVNREHKKAAIFATQLLPVDDPVAVELAMSFFQGAWGA